MFPLDEPVTVADMLATGATYRQIDYWARSGWFSKPTGKAVAPTPGTGRPRVWTGREHRICSLIVRFTHAGIETSTAARMARDAVDHSVNRVVTEDGVTIAWAAAS